MVCVTHKENGSFFQNFGKWQKQMFGFGICRNNSSRFVLMFIHLRLLNVRLPDFEKRLLGRRGAGGGGEVFKHLRETPTPTYYLVRCGIPINIL